MFGVYVELSCQENPCADIIFINTMSMEETDSIPQSVMYVQVLVFDIYAGLGVSSQDHGGNE